MSERSSQRLAAAIMLGVAICGLIISAYVAFTPLPSTEPLAQLNPALVVGLCLAGVGVAWASYYGWRWGPDTTILILAVLTGIGLPERFIIHESAMSIFIAPLVALVVGNAAWIMASTTIVMLIMVARSGPELIYLKSDSLIILLTIHAVMIIGRILLTSSQRTIEAQTRAAQARAAELEEANERLAASEGRVATIFRATPLPVVIVRMADGRIADLNDRGAQFIGRPREALVGQRLDALGLWYDLAEREAIRPLVLQGPLTRALEIRVCTARGVRTVEATVEEVDLSGERCCLAIIDDVTERKGIVEQLQRFADRQAILNQISRSILTFKSPDAIASAVLPILRTLIPCDQAALVLYDLSGSRAMVLAVDGQQEASVEVGTWTTLPSRAPLPAPFLRGAIWQIDNVMDDGQAGAVCHGTRGFRSILCAPLQVHGHVIGGLNFASSAPRAFQVDHQAVAAEVAEQFAVVIQSAQLLKGEQAARQRADQLHAANVAIARSLDLDQVIDALLTSLAQVAPYDAAGVLLQEPAGALHLYALRGDPQGSPVLTELAATAQLAGGWPELFAQTPMLGAGTSSAETWSRVGLALHAGGQFLGICSLYRQTSDGFNPDELRAAEALLATAGTAIANAQLFAQARSELQARTVAEQALAAEQALLAQRIDERTAELRAANIELARAARMKDAFLATMSHELRTPLNAILGYGELLTEGIYGPLNAAQQRAIGIIDDSGQHLLSLISDILDLTKIASGTFELEREPVELASLCEASLRLLRPQAESRGVALSAALDPRVQQVWGDERRLTQILVNLMTNAVKFTPAGGAVSLEVYGDAAQGEVIFAVSDTGIGIAEDDLPRLFQPFVQIDNDLSRRYEGTGLGLALVHQLAEAHGGSVGVLSELGRGSCFTVRLPSSP